MKQFHLNKKVSEFFTSEVVTATPDTSLSEISKLMVKAGCGEIPLVENKDTKKIVGVITDRDIVCRSLGIGKNPLNLKASDCMTSPCITGTSDMTVQECVNLMEKNKIRRLPIVDAKGAVCGLISEADIKEFSSEADVAALRKPATPIDRASGVIH